MTFLLFVLLQSQTPSATATVTPVSLTLRTADGRAAFRPGEIIPIELEFNSSTPKRFVVDGATYDRSGRLTIDEFTIEPNDGVSDPFLDYFLYGGGIGGGIRTMGVLGEQPFSVKLELNDWFRFDAPGTYRISVRSSRVIDESTRAFRNDSGAIVPVESNSIDIEILPRDEQWEANAFIAAVALLNSSDPYVDKRRGCRMLRFLGTDAAADEMIRRYDADHQSGCGFDYMAGLFIARNRARAVRQMEAALRDPDQPVSQGYLGTLARLSVYVRHPELRPPQTRETKGRMLPPQASNVDQSRYVELFRSAQESYTDLLVAVLPGKTERARAVTLAGLLDASRTGGLGRTIGRQLATVFARLPVDRQIGLLEYQWRSVAGPEMRPVLRRLIDAPAAKTWSGADIALRRLYDLAPEEGRAVILRQIVNPGPAATLKTLGVLPDRELPELDDALAGGIDAEVEFDRLSIRAELLHRYASRAVAPRVLSQIGEHMPRLACRPQAALLAYFLRADPAVGRTLLDRVMSTRTETGCYRSALSSIAALRMTLDVEAAAIGHLDDPDPQVVTSAIRTLGDRGSPSAKPLVLRHFERWHDVWRNRLEELQYSRARGIPAENAMVESAFLQALGRGDAWVTTARELATIRSLCVTDNCRDQARHFISAAGSSAIQPLRYGGRDDCMVSVAQYQLSSMDALEQKLLQYPKRTAFTLDTRALDAEASSAFVADVMKFAAAIGLTIRRP